MKLERICKRLVRTYNASFLHKEDLYIQAIFLSLAFRYKDSSPIFRFIYNMYNSPGPSVPYIDGPMSISLITIEDKRILLFGEAHGDRNTCKDLNKSPYIPFVQYLNSLIETTDSFIDFYIESSPFFVDIRTNSFVMNEVQKTFLETFKREGLSTARFHHIDIRNWENTKDCYNYTKIYKKRNKEVIKLLKDLKRGDPGELFFSFYLGNDLFKKEIERSLIPLEKFKELTKNYFSKEKIYAFPIVPILKDYPPEGDKNINIYRTYISYFIVVLSFMVDLYTLARMFKKFKDDSKTPSEPSTIIFYGGAFHQYDLMYMLEELGGEIKFFGTTDSTLSKTDHIRCLDMKDIPQPILRNYPYKSKMVLCEEFLQKYYPRIYLDKTLNLGDHHSLVIFIRDCFDGKIRNIISGWLSYTGNSCYLDSVLMSLFADVSDTIDKEFFSKSLTDVVNKDKKWMMCNEDKITDLEIRREVRKRLRDVVRTIRRGGETDCLRLREIFRKCRGSQRFDKPLTQDAGEFLDYLFSIFNIDTVWIKRKTYFKSTEDDTPVLSTSFINREASPLYRVKVHHRKNNISDYITQKETSVVDYKGENKTKIDVVTVIKADFLVFYIDRLNPVDGKRNTIPILPDRNIKIGRHTLSLSSIVVHIDNHYTSYLKIKGQWWYYNDIATVKLTPMKFLDVYHSEPSPLRLSTLLFYRRDQQ